MLFLLNVNAYEKSEQWTVNSEQWTVESSILSSPHLSLSLPVTSEYILREKQMCKKQSSSNRKNAEYHGALDTRLTAVHTGHTKG